MWLPSPLNALCEWVSSQPVEVCFLFAHEARQLLATGPAYCQTDAEDHALDRLVAFFAAAPVDPRPTLARVLMFWGILNLATFQYSANADDWRIRFERRWQRWRYSPFATSGAGIAGPLGSGSSRDLRFVD